jgi:hypothetical protein
MCPCVAAVEFHENGNVRRIEHRPLNEIPQFLIGPHNPLIAAINNIPEGEDA